MEWARIRMKYFARVVALNPYVEEEITLSLGEYEICCFINEPHLIKIGQCYLFELTLMFFNDIEINVSNHPIMSLTQVENTFSYQLTGMLFDNKLIVANLVFEDDLFYHYSYFENQYITVTVDRIDVEFIEPINHDFF